MLKALEDAYSNHPRPNKSVTKKASLSTSDSVAQPPETPIEPEVQQQVHHTTPIPESPEKSNMAELPTEKVTPQLVPGSTTQPNEHDEPDERGRTLERHSDTEPEDAEKKDDVLEDVRSRLYSVQKIVRRERSGSSQARDEMLHELGDMLDTAIATTMTPLNTPALKPRASFMQSRGVSLSPAKQPRSSIRLSRSQSVKNERPLLVRLSSRPRFLRDDKLRNTQTEVPTRAQSPDLISTNAPSFFGHRLDHNRNRQVSEPVIPLPRPSGFPLSSPVRERTLL